MMSRDESDTFWQEIREQFRGSEEIFRTIQKARKSDALVLNESGCIVRCSPGFARSMGYSSREIEEKKQISDLLREDETEKMDACLQQLLADPASPSRIMETVAVDRYGNQSRVTVSATAIPGTRQILVSGFCTGSRDAEGEESTDLLQSFAGMLEAARTCALILDEGGRVQFASTEFCRLAGCEKGDVEGKDSLPGFITGPDLRKIRRQCRKRITLKKQSPYQGEILLTDRKGRMHPLAIAVSGIPGISSVLLSGIETNVRRNAAAPQEDAEPLYRTIFEATGNGMAILGEDGTILLANRHFADDVGYAKSGIEGKLHISAFIPLPSWERLKHYCRLGRTPPDTASKQCEITFTDRQGARHDVLVWADRIPGTQKIVLSRMDITEKKAIERALAESETRFRKIFEECPFGMVIAAPDFRLTDANTIFCAMLGYTAEELRGRTFRDLTHPDDLPKDGDGMEKLRRGDIPIYETEKRYIRKDGEELRAAVTISTIVGSDGSTLGFIGMIEDVTERKNAEKALIESELRYRSFVENFQGVAFQCDLRFNPIFYHGAVADITGYSETELLTGKIVLPDLILPEDLENLRHDLRKMRMRPGYSIEGECRIITKRGCVRWMNYHIHNTVDEDGQPATINGTFYDITDRKVAEDALRSLERQLQMLAENSRDVIYRIECSPVPRFSYVSSAIGPVFGYSQSELYADSAVFFSAIHPGDTDRLDAVLAGNVPEGTLLTLRWIRKDGKVIWTEHRDVPFFDENGNMIAIEGICRDITDRKMAEDELRDTEERYRSLVELSPETVFVVRDGKILYTNSAGIRLFGTENAGELVGMPLLDLFAEEYHDGVSERMRRLSPTNQKSPFIEEKIVTGSGDEIDVEVGMVRIPFEGDHATQIIMRDISHRKKAEEALRQSRERYRMLVEVHPEPILIHADGNIVYINPSGIRYFGGETINDLLGKPVLELIHEDDRDRAVERIRTIYRDAVQTPIIEEKLLRLDGGILEAEVRSVPIHYEGRKAIQTIIRDISHRKRSEEEIRQRNNQLSIINQIIRVANSSLILNEMLEISLKKTLELLSFDMGWIYLKHPDGIRAELIAHEGVPDYFIEKGSFLNIRDWPNNMIFFAGQPRYIENLPHHPPGIFDARLLEDVDALCLAGVPLIADSVVVGALYIGRREGYSFREEEKITLESIGKEIGGTILRGMLQDQLEEAYEEANLYLEVMEHDIKTANASILGYLNLIRETVEGTAARYAGEMAAAVRQSIETIANVATIRKINEETCPCIPVDLDAVIRAEAEQFPAANITYHDSGYQVYADELLPALFTNLIGNSIKFGGPEVEIRITVEEQEDKLTVSVEDSGCGVPDGNKQEIFNYFQKNSPEATGRGLGLYVCRLLAERYGGKIWAEDRIAGLPAEGLAVRFTLYIADED